MKVALNVMEDVHIVDSLETKRERKALGSVLGRTEAVAEVLDANLKTGIGAPLQSSDDSESEEDGKVIKKFVAFGARKEESSESSDSDVSTNSEDYHVMLNKWLNLKNENLRLQHELVQGHEQYEDLAEELADVNEKNEALEKEEVLQRAAVSNKPKLVHQCNNMKVRHEVLKHGCAAGTRKETDRYISNCVRPSKKQHRMCCWFCEKVGHKKV
ncbi:hypothetical protein F2Q69_00055913 [Brassica cretica]|uniref:Uncharacterized protein n=1 Tax=Brassica cretica TaxID=69181 RepID=A0A8S9N7T2_BRACR|nr:hypothetical protein F2Q69_00055913 [Brassica cretica]